MLVRTLKRIALVIASCFGVFVIAKVQRKGAQRAARRSAALLEPSIAVDPHQRHPHPWVIANPSKHASRAEFENFQQLVNSAAAELGIPHIHWLETTVEDPGTGQSIRALEKGASVVIAAGGDGTVRAVGAGIAGSGVRMGILPVGTGNLLARNLNIPLDDIPAALQIALGPNHQALDLGWLRVEDVVSSQDLPAEGALVRHAYGRSKNTHTQGRIKDLPRRDEYAFLVISGLGFDGETMAKTNPALKKRIGWLAYVASGLASLTTKDMTVRLAMYSPYNSHPDWYSHPDVLPPEVQQTTQPTQGASSLPVEQEATTPPTLSLAPVDEEMSVNKSGVPSHLRSEETELTAKSFMFANCGELPFITLAPDAELDDGLLDVIAVDVEAGLIGWADLSRKLVGQSIGFKADNFGISTGKIAFRQASYVHASTEDAQVVQVDGDAIAEARTVFVRIQAHALDIAVAAPQ